MPRVAIVTDSTADLTPEVRMAHGIAVVPLNVTFGSESYRDQVDMTTDQFLARMTASEELPTTSQPSPAVFQSLFDALSVDHDEIVAVLLSSKLSGTVSSATLASTAVTGRLRVEVVDSFNVSLGLGFQVLRAAELAADGCDAEEIARILRADVSRYNLIFFVDTLEYLRRGGRIGGAASLIGSLLQLKPVLRLDEGQVVPYERTRTKARAIAALRDVVLGWPAINRLGVIYGSDRAEAERFLADLPLRLPSERIMIAQLSPVLSAHVGPGVMGVCIDDAEVT